MPSKKRQYICFNCGEEFTQRPEVVRDKIEKFGTILCQHCCRSISYTPHKKTTHWYEDNSQYLPVERMIGEYESINSRTVIMFTCAVDGHTDSRVASDIRNSFKKGNTCGCKKCGKTIGLDKKRYSDKYDSWLRPLVYDHLADTPSGKQKFDSFDYSFRTDPENKFEWVCSSCGCVYKRFLSNVLTPQNNWCSSLADKFLCESCSRAEASKTRLQNFGRTHQGKTEDKFLEFIKTIYPDAYHAQKLLGNKEVDIYIPSLHKGVEFDGIVWHKEFIDQETYRQSGMNSLTPGKYFGYHHEKDQSAADNDILLYHVCTEDFDKDPDLYTEQILEWLQSGTETVPSPFDTTVYKELTNA